MSATADRFKRLGDVLRGEQERALGRRAILAGLLSESELAELLARGEGVERSLRARGLGDDQIRRLRENLDREEYALFRPDRRAPPEALAVQDEPDRRLAEFVLVTRLGQGGVGEVWKAWDLRLGRWVAVKLPKATPDLEAATRRFTREALAAARLSHPNIVSIYRVAEENGRCFIVMQFVEGRTLGQERPAPRQALEILRRVALAVHHAHEQGVVHRDLKPGNILIAPDGRPFVLDFGLAHLEEASGPHSREGLVAGTAAYMSPEQARGGAAARGRSTDIYSLGATLYEAVTGKPPFEGASFAEILQKVLHEEPAPPHERNAAVTRDVESVILKAMDKDPARRYATAQDLADDLDRCLREEPVTAARNPFWRTFRRAVLRSRRLALGLGAAGVLAMAAGGWTAVRAAREARERESKLQAFRDLARVTLEAVLALRRAGANDQMGTFWPRLEASYREAQSAAPDLAELDALVGRVHRALLNDARARECQDRALAKDPSYVLALYEKVVLLARAGRPVGPSEAARLEGSGTPAARGVLAFLRGAFAEAREPLRKALEADPGMEEAWELLARSHAESATEHSAPATQEEAYDRAIAVFTDGLAKDKGYVPLWAGRARAFAARAFLRRETGRDPQQDVQAAEDDFAQALRWRPSAELYRARGAMRGRVGVHRLELGGNPVEDFAEAERDFAHALRLDPADAATIAEQVLVRGHRARYRVERGENPEEELRAGASEAERALSLDAGRSDVILSRAGLVGLRAIYGASVGEDPTELFDGALRLFEEALRRRPGDPQGLERRAYFRLEKVRIFSLAQRDVREDLAAALADAEEAVEKTPFFNRARITRAAALRLRGLEEQKAGRDPAAFFGRARADLDEVLELNPLSTDAWVQAGHLEQDRGHFRMQASDRAGARDRYTQAVRSYEEALRLNPFIPGRLREPLREARRALLATY
jgi:serine/threonine-protein kinase